MVWMFSWIIKKYRRYRFELLIVTIIFTGFLWAIGLLDHLSEKPFHDFKWTPYNDIKEQIRHDLAGDHTVQRSLSNDWSNFEPRLLPRCPLINVKIPENFLLIIVKSAAPNIAHREAIRATWGTVTSYLDYTIRTIFLVGRMLPIEEQKMGNVLASEAGDYGDLLIGDFIDDYKNNTLKFMSAVQFSYKYCSRIGSVPFAFFVDDDYFVSIPNLVTEIQQRKSEERLYMGWKFDTTPFRLRFHKHRLSLGAYPYDRFPPYISAGCVLYNRRTIEEFYMAIQYTPTFPYDDIYAGILAHLLGLSVIHNDWMRYWFGAVSDDDAHKIICAHGFGPRELTSRYQELHAKGLV